MVVVDCYVLAPFLPASFLASLINLSRLVWLSSFGFPFLGTDTLRSLLPHLAAAAFFTMSPSLLSPGHFDGLVPLVPVTSSPVPQKVSNVASAKTDFGSETVMEEVIMLKADQVKDFRAKLEIADPKVYQKDNSLYC